MNVEFVLSIAAFFILGAIGGSFVSVVVARGPRAWGLVPAENEGTPETPPLAAARSRCPSCDAVIAPWDLIPVLSFLRLRGRCAACKRRIDRLYPLLELCGATIAGVALLAAPTLLTAGALLGLGLTLLALGTIDARTGFLPDALTVPLMMAGLTCGVAGVLVPLEDSALGVVGGWSFFALIAFFYGALRQREGLGGGDTKLLAAGGAFTGLSALPFVVLIASVTALVAALLSAQRARGDMEIRFGPYLSIGIYAVAIARAAMPDRFPIITG